MTAEELDEVIEKAVKAFEKIEVVDTELAERLVEQGILSYDDLSVMEISDLVNTIEGLTEEQAIEIVAKAEVLAEAQTEELPRRKGARASASEPAPAVETLEEGESETDTDISADGSPTADEYTETDSVNPVSTMPQPWNPARPCPPSRVQRGRGRIIPTTARIRSVTRPATTRSTTWPWRKRNPITRPMVMRYLPRLAMKIRAKAFEIVTEAVEQSGPEAAAAAPSATNREPAVSPRHSTPPASASLSNQHSDGARRSG